MKMRPIIFDSESIRAILDGRKMMTRRVIKPQPQATCSYERNGETFTGVILPDQPAKWCGGLYWRYGAEWGARPDTSQPFPRCPYGIAGDGLWVRETWKDCLSRYHDTGNPDDHGGPNDPCVGYRATMTYTCGTVVPPPEGMHRWRPSIFMPRVASRIDLAVTGMRVERLQDITYADIIAEGILIPRASGWLAVEAREAFAARWDAINAKRGYPWANNDWVWVPEFERVNASG